MRFRMLMTLVGLLLLEGLIAASSIPRANAKSTYRALYDFASQATGESDLQKGELVIVLQQDASGWWLVEKLDGSSEGWAPASYLSKIASGPSSSAKTGSSSKTHNKKSSTSKLSSSSTNPSKPLSSAAIKRSSTSARSSTFAQPSNSAQQSTSARPSASSPASVSSQPPTSVRPSSTPSLHTSSSLRFSPSSINRNSPISAIIASPLVVSVPPLQSLSSSPYLSNLRTSSHGVIAASTVATNATLDSSIDTFLSTASVTGSSIASTVAPLSSSSILNVSTSAAPSLLKPLNVSSADLYKMAGAVPSLKVVNSSAPMITGSQAVSLATNTSAGCLVNCETTTWSLLSSSPTTSQTQSSNLSECLVNCNTTTTSPTPTNNSEGCLVNCSSTNSSIVNSMGQASPHNASNAAVPTECADPGGVNGVTAACWNALGMRRYVDEWIVSHQGVCQAQTSFAQCFLEILDIGMNDCVSISSGTCPPPSWIQFKDHNMSVRDFYVAYNIYAVWTFFNSYYSAIGNARSAATDSVAAIVSLLDPPKTNNAELSNINFALLIGLTFVKIEGFISPVLESVVGFVVNAARQVPQVARYLFPGPPGDTKFTQLGQISNQMGTLTDNLQKNVAIALSVIQNDTATFLSFTGTGAFSNNPVVKMDQQSNNLLTALNTYVISLCLQANKWQISRAIDTDVNQLMANGTHLTWNITDCGTGYDSNSICGGYYFNKTIDVSYTLTNTEDMFRNPQPILQQFFANWTTPQLLFDGALQCQMAKGTGNPNISPTAGATDVTSTPCLSSLKICTWDLNPSHFGTQYEYTDCDVQSNFATQGCTNCDATTDFCTNVPSTYMGGYLLNSQAEGPQYVYCDDGHTLINTN